MKIGLFLFVEMIVLTGWPETSVAQQARKPERTSKVSPELWKKPLETGTVRVIVDLDVPVQAEANLDQNGIRLQRQAITEAQDKLLAELIGTKHEGRSRLITVSAIGLRVGPDALEILERSMLVKKVTEDRVLNPSIEIQTQKSQ